MLKMMIITNKEAGSHFSSHAGQSFNLEKRVCIMFSEVRGEINTLQLSFLFPKCWHICKHIINAVTTNKILLPQLLMHSNMIKSMGLLKMQTLHSIVKFFNIQQFIRCQTSVMLNHVPQRAKSMQVFIPTNDFTC